MKARDKYFDVKAEAQVKACLKSEEEIKKHTWDDKQPLSKNIAFALTTAAQEQKNSVLRNLPMYCRDAAVASAILPVLCVSLPTHTRAQCKTGQLTPKSR